METNIISTAIVLVILIAIFALIIRSMIKSKKAGKSLQCGGNCKNCHNSCKNSTPMV